MAFHRDIEAIYRGRNNSCKLPVFYALAHTTKPLTALQLSHRAGVTPEYLYHRLPAFCRWTPPYTLRVLHNGTYRYKLGQRGYRFLENATTPELLERTKLEYEGRARRGLNELQ